VSIGSQADPLSSAEEDLWRALMRIVLSLRRRLDGYLLTTERINASELDTLVSLSEASGRGMRMTDLALATGLSASRMTRLVDDLQSRGLVSKRASAVDGRGNVAILTPAGLGQLRMVWTAYVTAVRRLVLDHVDPAVANQAAQALSTIAARLADST
jgi:DNA-binding MarR family transcriptional regulator